MRLGRLRASEGQTLAEYAVVITAIAVGCVLVAVFVGAGIGGLFDTSAKPVRSGGYVPPVHGAPFPSPETVGNCTDDPGYDYYGMSLEECLEAVEG